MGTGKLCVVGLCFWQCQSPGDGLCWTMLNCGPNAESLLTGEESCHLIWVLTSCSRYQFLYLHCWIIIWVSTSRIDEDSFDLFLIDLFVGDLGVNTEHVELVCLSFGV